MRVVTSQEMAELEAKGCQFGGLQPLFMEEAGRGISMAVCRFVQENGLPPFAWLLCGKGNNGGDALAAGRHLIESGFEITAVLLDEPEQCSPLCQANLHRFIDKKGTLTRAVPSFEKKGVILDGLFGTGFRGAVGSPYSTLIEAANASALPILAIDIPSGLNGSSGDGLGAVICATKTLFLAFPKLGFFLQDGWNAVGKLEQIDFGLSPLATAGVESQFSLITKQKMACCLPPINRNRHKYQTGSVISVAGSLSGAAILASFAALRAGCGIVKLFHPKGLEAEFSGAPYELIKNSYSSGEESRIASAINQSRAALIGPGLGREESAGLFLRTLAPKLTSPCVMDADALFHYAKAPFELPPKVIFTPHLGEMQLLLGSKEKLKRNLPLIQQCASYAKDHQLTLVLKGAPTFIFQNGQSIAINPTGDPGMATAGSGDVLTGILSALLSQGLDPYHTALLGVWLHGKAGEIAAKMRGTSRGMMASDLIEHLNMAISSLNEIDIQQPIHAI